MVTAESLHASPNAIAHHYSRFRVAERLLLTGHSHQAWPDCGYEGQQQAWTDAAELVDDKWGAAFEKANAVRRGFARLLGEPDADIALGQNTHELVTRLLSALPLKQRRKIVTTDGEFHSARRQFDRLAEDWLDVVKVPALPADGIAERLCDALDENTAMVYASSVLFRNANIVPGLGELATACTHEHAVLVVDAYHHLNAVPFSVQNMGLDDAFVVGGGYKYCQLGEGNCFLRMPKGCGLRPVLTGWYSEFDALSDPHDHRVAYGQRGNRFGGATYDPASHYRAAAVFEFFEENGLSPEVLREVSQHQVKLLAEKFDALDLDPSLITRDRDVPFDRIAGFLTLTSARPGDVCSGLKSKGVSVDYRGDVLRFGPAPYLSDDQLEDAMTRLGEVCRSL